MRRLKPFYILSVICLAAFFHILYSQRSVSFGYVNLLFLFAAPIAYICPKMCPLIVSIASWVVIYPIFALLYKVHVMDAALPILTFNGYFIAISAHRNHIKDLIAKYGLGFMAEGNAKEAQALELKMLRDAESDIRDRELKIMSLYEITKKMSGSMKFEEIFNVLADFIKVDFMFRRCELAILDWDGETARAFKIFNAWRSRKKGDSGFRVDYGLLVKMFRDNQKMLTLSRNNDRAAFKDLKIEDDEVASVIAVPLFSENRIAAVLTVDNLAESDKDRFMIVASQFSLEIKKVLLYETVETLAITDGLTGLFVRRYFMERLNEELFRSERHKFSLAFLMLDIDNFKKCNDTYGHLVGDVILKEASRIIKESVREIDLVSRYGGEEFALVLPETGRDGARLVAERLRGKIADNVFRAYDERLRVTVSIGLSVYPEDSEDMKKLIAASDSALYAAKKSGKNIVCDYRK